MKYQGGRYVRENWKEWFVVEVAEGLRRPPFYLFTHYRWDRRTYYAWIFPLAPIILLLVALGAGFYSVWEDLVRAVGCWRRKG